MHGGQSLRLCSTPLDAYLQQNGAHNIFQMTSTANWRGYVGSWELAEDKLYLVGLTGMLKDGTRANLQTIFPEHPDRVFADWYSGTLRVTGGELLEYVHGGFASRYERDILFEIKNGILISSQTKDNRQNASAATDDEKQRNRLKRLVQPPIEDHEKLRQPMTPGEQKVFDLFNECLAPEWEIYIQPHVNGLRPDFVLLHPNVGIAVFEVKDWDLDAMHYFIRDDVGRPSLWAERDERFFCIQSQNPVSKVNLYKKEIQELYCPRLSSKYGFAAITAGVIFPFADAARVKELFRPFLKFEDHDKNARYQPITGRTELRDRDLEAVFPEAARSHSHIMNPALAEDLRGWLVEPDFSATQRRPLELDRNQRALVETRTKTGYRRIRGAAGSGKSLVLAARAAKLASEGQSVLVATFNITLWHYLRDLIVRGIAKPSDIRNIRLTHFHHWCSHVCEQVGWEDEYAALFQGLPKGGDAEAQAARARRLNAILEVELPALASAAAEEPDAERFDAILVDEGQDYRLPWWNALRKVLKDEGEMLLVADTTQDVYGTAKAWTEEAMRGAGFAGGPWAELEVSYRMPARAHKMVRAFAKSYLPPESLILPFSPQGTLEELEPCNLRWVQCTPEQAGSTCVSEILRLMHATGESGLANADITFLCESTSLGRDVTEALQKRRIRSVETYSLNKDERRRQKMGFYMGDARIKATTMHSFKGWESRLLVINVDHAMSRDNLHLLYAGLTRLKRSVEGSWLTIVCSAPHLLEFGARWPDFVHQSEAHAEPIAQLK